VRFAADAPDMRKAVALDALTVLYHRRSAATHIVAEPVPEILAALGEGDADLDALARRLGVDDREALSARLDELVATGLVRAA
jgi:PqqD family protein of HPr-rel-A system